MIKNAGTGFFRLSADEAWPGLLPAHQNLRLSSERWSGLF
jgi:hypothetical protein